MKEFYSLMGVAIEDILDMYAPFELEILLMIEPDCVEIDIMLENMEYFFVEEEKYEYAAIVRDEIKRRFNKQNNRKLIKHKGV